MYKEFYIFRHGESTYNIKGLIQGRLNTSVLTEKGKLQAEKIGWYLKDKNIEIILTSPLLRAKQTAEIANKFLNVSIVEDERFIEVDVGVVEGMHHTQATLKYAEDYAKWRDKRNLYPDLCFEGGETKRQVQERVFLGLRDWVEKSDNSVIAIASHGVMLGQIMVALGVADEGVDNGSVLHLIFDDDKWIFDGVFSVNEKDEK